jgi:hypothetical protein
VVEEAGDATTGLPVAGLKAVVGDQVNVTPVLGTADAVNVVEFPTQIFTLVGLEKIAGAGFTVTENVSTLIHPA